MDAYYIFISKKFEEEMNNLLNQTKEKECEQINKILEVNFKKHCCEGFFPKRGCATKRIPWRYWSFIFQKHFTNLVCGEYPTETFGFAFMSKTKFPFQKTIYTRNIDKASGENKSVVCSYCIGIMSLCNC